MIKIGFANLDDTSPFSIAVRDSLIAAAQQHPDIELIVRENKLDDQRALANCHEFMQLGVDLVIMYHVNQRFSPELKKVLQVTPVIAVDIPMTLTPYFGVNNREAGEMLGNALANWVDDHWEGQLDKLLVLVESRVLDAVRERVHGPVEVLTQRYPHLADNSLYVDCGNTYTATLHNTTDVLSNWREQNRIAIIGFNEDSTIGALDAAKSLHMSQQIVVAGHGASKMLLERMHEPDTRLAATTAYHPEQYGEPLLDMALRVINKERSIRTSYVPVSLLLTQTLVT